MEYSGNSIAMSSAQRNPLRSDRDDWFFLEMWTFDPKVNWMRHYEVRKVWSRSTPGRFPGMSQTMGVIPFSLQLPIISMPSRQCRRGQSEILVLTARLNTEIIECLNSWQKEGIISSNIIYTTARVLNSATAICELELALRSNFYF